MMNDAYVLFLIYSLHHSISVDVFRLAHTFKPQPDLTGGFHLST